MAKKNILDYSTKQKDICLKNDNITENMYEKYSVNRGLRDINGKGILTGLTNISKITSMKNVDGVNVPVEGELWYRGYKVNSLIDEIKPGEFGFEKVAYLLLFGKKPTDKEYAEFTKIISENRTLPTNFTRDVIMKAPSKDIMNSMTRSILTLASYDENISSMALEDSIRQCLLLIAQFPMLAIYGYHAYNHIENYDSMFIHRPDPNLSTAENILRMLRPDKKYTPIEAHILDIALILHMEHGGGNNSTFTTRVVTSAGTDTYSAIAAAMSSLKGPKHGGANIKVMEMMKNIKENISDTTDRDEIREYLSKMLAGEVFDNKGLIYGLGHAVYSLSDPREIIFKEYVKELAHNKGKDSDMELYNIVEEEGLKLINSSRHIYKGVCPNVDFYSGFVYDMLDIPVELYTPLFAIARIVGWSSHRIEELICMNKIIRPAYMSVMKELE
ncbi:MAG: citrate synthase [Bacteroidaceae bacterium]|nr:citrate synthase [Bacteroidaceae bacterium]MCQ2088539.1 citrate synthase [Bacilli bacterium]